MLPAWSTVESESIYIRRTLWVLYTTNLLLLGLSTTTMTAESHTANEEHSYQGSKVVSLRISEERLSRLDQITNDREISRSEAIRRGIDQLSEGSK